MTTHRPTRPEEITNPPGPKLVKNTDQSGAKSGDHATACVDFSAVNGGAMTAYRWTGETRIQPGNYVSVGAPFLKSTTATGGIGDG